MKTQRDDNQYGIEAIPTRRPRPSITPTSTTPTSSSGSCRCGIRKGGETQLHQYPWQVALVRRSGNIPFCGGSLISRRSVLTAANCQTWSLSFMSVLVGGNEKISATKWISHPDYDRETTDNDISIITLARDVRFSDNVIPVCLPWSSFNSYAFRRATVAGWGSLKRGRSHALRGEDVYTMTNNRCKYDYRWTQSLINSGKICAASSKHPTCPGDSGGPMVILEDGAFTLIGVHSSGLRCAQDAQPGVYSRVTSYLDWIMMEISGETCQRN